MKRAMVKQFKHKASYFDLCKWLSIPRSSHYYRASNNKRGRKPTQCTTTKDGAVVENQAVVTALIEKVYSQEFVRYGYQLSTEELQELGFKINVSPRPRASCLPELGC